MPEEDQLAEARSTLHDQLTSASAERLYQAGSTSDDASQSYVLLRAAADKAAAACDFATTFAALDALAGEFQFDHLTYETELLRTFAQQEGDLPYIDLALRATALTTAATTANRPELARRGSKLALRFGRESGSRTLVRQATLLVIDLEPEDSTSPIAASAPHNP